MHIDMVQNIVTGPGPYNTRARRTSSVDPTGYICLAGTGCGILRASLEILGAQATQRYELLADTAIEYIPDGAVVCYEVCFPNPWISGTDP
jgi:hypothetical protein